MKHRTIAFNFLPPNKDGETEIEIYDAIADQKSIDWWTGEEGTEVTPLDFKEKLNAVDTQDVVLRVNSGGGSVFAANAISTAIQEFVASGRKAKCKIDGLCASAAVQIALSCSEVSIHESALMMIHNPATFMFGYVDINELNKAENMLTATKNAILDLYEKKTGQGRQKLSNMMDAETWFSGKEAVENGFADSVMFEDMGIQNSAVLGRIRCAYNMAEGLKIPDRFNIPEPENNLINKGVENTMDINTVDDLMQNFPDLMNQAKAEAVNAAHAEAVEKGVAQERARIQAIDEMAGKVSDELLNRAKYETFDTAENVAMEAIKTGAFMNASVLNAMQQETAAANGVAGLTNNGNGKEPIDEKKQAENHASNVAAAYLKKLGKGE